MGCEGSKVKMGTNVENNIIALVMLDDTEAIVRKTKAMGEAFKVNEQVNVRGDTLLHYAAKRNNQQLIRYLLSCPGANKNVKNSLGKTPIDLAASDAKILFA